MTAGTADRTHAPDKRAGILYPAMLIAAIGVIVFSVVGIASMMGWLPGVFSGGSAGNRGAGASSSGAVRPQVTLAPCEDCGMIESIRAHKIEQDKKSAVTYQITVRMSDGTTRAVYEPTPPAHAIGERVRVSERGVVAAR